jgi:hypothetical protein
MGNANSGKKGDQVENGKRKTKLHRNSYLVSGDFSVRSNANIMMDDE